MRLKLIAAGTRLPGWVTDGYRDYAARMGRECRLELVEIPVTHRGRNADTTRMRAEEGRRMLAALDAQSYVTALDVAGATMDTAGVAAWLGTRMQAGRDVALLVGGPDGLDPACLDRADFRWSLSPLTFPHGLVRVLVAEQLYRGFSLLKGHPYHRA